MRTKILIIFGLMLIMSACNGVSSKEFQPTSTTYPWNSFAVTSPSDLPGCSGDIVGRLYYIESTASFKVCKSTGWTDIAVKGNDGSNGNNGITISSIKSCAKSAGGAYFQHKIVTYSTNDKFVFCSVSSLTGEYSSSAIYKSTQIGSVNEGCIVGYDVDTPSSGFWSFTLNGGNRTAVYTDSGSGQNGTSVSFAVGDCSTI